MDLIERTAFKEEVARDQLLQTSRRAHAYMVKDARSAVWTHKVERMSANMGILCDQVCQGGNCQGTKVMTESKLVGGAGLESATSCV
jgi:hypothetical protein